jgi:hypothetical protein
MSTIFDQRGQQVQNQYNAAGNVNIGIVPEKNHLIKELQALREKIKELENVDNDTTLEAEYHVIQATKEVKKDEPATNTFFDHMNKAKVLLENIVTGVGITDAVIRVIELAKQVFV